MISYLSGTIRTLQREPAHATVVAGGVGYDVTLPAFVLQALIQEGIREGSEIELEIYYHVTDRNPRPMLVGFKRQHEKRFFEQLLEVEGVGPARAAAALVFSVSTVARAIEGEDLRVLTRMPGIGARAAQKMVAALRGKVTDTALLRDEGFETAAPVPAPADLDPRDEAAEALVSLGYKSQEASSLVEHALETRPDLAGDAQGLMREIFRAQAGHTAKTGQPAL